MSGIQYTASTRLRTLVLVRRPSKAIVELRQPQQAAHFDPLCEVAVVCLSYLFPATAMSNPSVMSSMQLLIPNTQAASRPQARDGEAKDISAASEAQIMQATPTRTCTFPTVCNSAISNVAHPSRN